MYYSIYWKRVRCCDLPIDYDYFHHHLHHYLLIVHRNPKVFLVYRVQRLYPIKAKKFSFWKLGIKQPDLVTNTTNEPLWQLIFGLSVRICAFFPQPSELILTFQIQQYHNLWVYHSHRRIARRTKLLQLFKLKEKLKEVSNTRIKYSVKKKRWNLRISPSFLNKSFRSCQRYS